MKLGFDRRFDGDSNIAPPSTATGNLAVLARPLIAVFALASCDVGSVLGQSGTDGGDGAACINAATPGPTHVHAAGGTSNVGLACIASGCHLEGNMGTGATAFAFAGTLYTSAAGTSILSGATIQVKSGTETLSAVSDLDGNFVLRGTLTFPATTVATQCPSLIPMIGSLSAGGGNCNNCHRPGGVTTPVYLQ